MLGSGATAGMVVSITVNGGTGYTAVPTVTIAPPTAPATIGTVTLNGSGSITIPVASGGAGYLIPPAVKLTGGTFNSRRDGDGESRQRRTAGMVVSITVNGGTGYIAVPTVTIAPPAVPATAGTVTLSGGSITIPVANGGTGYLIAPTVTLTGGTFTTAATATANLGTTSQTAGHGRVDHHHRRDGLHRGPDRHDRPPHAAHRKLQRNHRRPDPERRRPRGGLPDSAPVGHVQRHQHQPVVVATHRDVHRE